MSVATVMVMVQVLYIEQNQVGAQEPASKERPARMKFDSDLDEALGDAPAR